MITNKVTLKDASFNNFTLYSLTTDGLKDSWKNNTCLVWISLLTTTTSNEKKVKSFEIHETREIF